MGGPSHIDTFDLKPEAPVEYRGDFRPIDTSLDGCRISEPLPRIAKIMKKLALVRSLTSLEGNHDRASHLYWTGHHPSPALVYPSMGSVAAREFGIGGALPSFVAIPSLPEYTGAGYLGVKYDPFTTGAKPEFGLGISEERLQRRKELLAEVDRFHRGIEDPRESFYRQAFDLLTSSEAKRAFDLEREEPKVKERYGPHLLGRSCLLARRLVEAGAKFVTVNDQGWDTHQDNFRRLRDGFPGKLPGLDQAFSALVEDLDSRGLLKKTLVILMGEFGRTPKINSNAGRDHWPRANSAVLAGGGIRPGQVVGSTDATGELPADRPVEPEDLVATAYALLGIDPRKEYHAGSRPIRVLARGEVIRELV
jgi:hypothetical protein